MNPALDEHNFQRARALLSQSAGIELNQSKRQMTSNRLSKPMQRLGILSFDAYLSLVEQDKTQLEAFVNAMTTNVTAFFREPHHYPVVAEFLKGKIAQARLWSAGCSTGQEPYSILFKLALAWPGELELRRTPLIVASDIDTQALMRARDGIYKAVELRAFTPNDLARFFDLKSSGEYQVKAGWRRLVDFRQQNLCDPKLAPHGGKVDVIFCRNVMIYFGTALQRQITQRFANALKPGALLVAGHSEMMLHSDELLESLGQTVYRLR